MKRPALYALATFALSFGAFATFDYYYPLFSRSEKDSLPTTSEGLPPTSESTLAQEAHPIAQTVEYSKAKAFPLRLMSYNVRNGSGMDNVRNFDRSAAVINQYRPDIVALQELDKGTQRSGNKDVLQEIATRVGMKGQFAKGITLGSGEYGIGLMFKHPPLNVYTESLPGTEEKRALIRAEFPDYWIYATHFSLTAEDQFKSLDMIVDWAQQSEKPVFVMGDLNFRPTSAQFKHLLRNFHVLTNTELKTYPADKPNVCIDYILQYKGKSGKTPPATTKDPQVIEAPIQSDHRPIMVTVDRL